MNAAKFRRGVFMKRNVTLGLVFAGFLAAVVGTSFADPAARPVTDAYAAYSGEATTAVADQVDYIVHLEWSDYVLHLEWRDVLNSASAVMASDQLFDR
jgi:hypothetical protein